MFTRLMRKGLDICPLPADVRNSCFRGGAGVRGGKPPVDAMSQRAVRVGKCRRLSVSSSSSGGGQCLCL